jgi:hypothetical protein
MESHPSQAGIRPILIRVTGPRGTCRIKIDNTSTIGDFFDVAERELDMAPGSLALSTDLPGHQMVARDSRSFKQCGLRHGDQLFIQTGVGEYMSEPTPMETDASPVPQRSSGNKTFRIDDVPDIQEEGVQAKYTPTMAIVNEAYLKHRKGVNSSHPFVDVGLDNIDFTSHQGFNSFKKASGHTRLHLRDAPKSVILTGQKHRHLDNVQMVDNGGLRNFITAWQNAGMAEQCMGFLYGEYTTYDAFEHGAKAVVHALYEPPQMGQVEGFTILPDPTNEQAERVARMLGLCRVGWTFTSPARHKTDSDEPFKRLSSSEVAVAAHFQEKTQLHHQGCLTPISRFFTLMIQPEIESNASGMAANVEPLAFQVTDQAVALHRDNILEQPHKLDFCAVRKPSSPDDFVAPVIYQGNDVDEVDVDFLVIDVPVTVQAEAVGMFQRNSFPTRLFLKRDPSVNELKGEFRRYGHLPPHELLSDFNLLVFLASIDSLKDEMQAICDCVRLKQPLTESAQEKLRPYLNSSAAPASGSASGFSAPTPAPAPQGGNNEALSTLMAMGYSQEQAKFALDAAQGDVNNAVNILLNS